MYDTIVRVQFGSHLYGTSTPASDVDYKSIHIPDAKDILLQRVSDSISNKRVKAEGERNNPDDIDDESYSLQRYLSLLAEGQTVAIDMLFAPEDKLLFTCPLWKFIRENKDRLLTKRSAAFVGYCRQQANKYGIKGSRVAAVKAAVDYLASEISLLGPHRKVYEIGAGLERLCGEHTEIVSKETTPDRFETYFMCCNRCVGFNNTIGEAYRIFSHIYEEYGDRARKAQANEGIDWKALSHAVRVGNEALELLKTGAITFPLPNAAHVLDIKLGWLKYDTVAEEIEQLLLAVEEAAKTSTLREESDREWIDTLVQNVYKDKIFSEKVGKIHVSSV